MDQQGHAAKSPTGRARTGAVAPSPGRRLVGVAPGVWVATARIWSTTSTVVVDEAGDALVVDPALTVAEIDALATEIHRRGWRVTGGFTTHPHWDHALWAASLGGAPRWATARAAAELRRRAEHSRAEAERHAPGHDLACLAAVAALPDGATALPGREAAVIEHTAHAPGHAALVVGDVLVAGDMLSDTEVPLLDEEAADPLGDYRRALDLLERAVAVHDVRVLVPGHGGPATGAGAVAGRFAADRAYLDALEARAAVAADPADDAIDTRIAGYVAAWHRGQLDALRRRTSAAPRSGRE